jgi:SAM-dependent methyltransferase
MPASVTLRRADEVEAAVERLRRVGLGPHPDVRAKSWDMALAVETITGSVDRGARILDVGARWSPILDGLEHLGYRDIWACDLERSWRDDLRRTLRRSRVRFRLADLTNTGFAGASFDAITSLSVIEHGVDVGRYFTEMARLLRKGGVLITSTDFWCSPVDTQGIYPYGPKLGQMRVFGPDDIGAMISQAADVGLRLDGPLDTRCEDPVVTWHRVGRSYTFTYFELHRR